MAGRYDLRGNLRGGGVVPAKKKKRPNQGASLDGYSAALYCRR
jgi:hypothetical protein